MARSGDNCCLCGSLCDGSLMRTDKRYTRVRNMLLDESVPRRPHGGIALCHSCQREVYFKGGFLDLLVKRVQKTASRYGAARQELASKWTPPVFVEAPRWDDEESAYKAFLAMRWPGSEPECPRCGSHRSQEISTRNIWRCKDCQKQYSATSGTPFAGRKLSYVEMMKVMAAFTSGGNASAAARAIGSQPKTGWLLQQKMNGLSK